MVLSKRYCLFLLALGTIAVKQMVEQMVLLEPFFRRQHHSLQEPQSSEINGNGNATMSLGALSKLTMTTTWDRAASVAAENLRVGQSSEKIFSHFLSHIPKTGASHATFAINNLLYVTPDWLALSPTDRYRVCYQATTQVKHFQGAFRHSFKDLRCAMWTTEQPYSLFPKHTYTIVRNPMTHVVSQFFHCKESRDHARTRRYVENVTIATWLETWATAAGNATLESQAGKRFHCYNTINLQSRYVPIVDDVVDLVHRYDVIGDQSQMDLSVCMMAIRMSGFMPPQCNCTSSSSSSMMRPPQRRRRLRVDHGVTHHGDTFNLTSQEVEWIHQLTKKDQLLYRTAVEVMTIQRKQIEDEFGVTLCEKIE